MSIRVEVHPSLHMYLSGQSCMHLQEESFWVLYPAFSFCLEYEETSPKSGKMPLPFLKKLVTLCIDSDIGEVIEKERLVFKFLLQFPDVWIWGIVMELKSLVFANLWCLVETREKQILLDASLARVAQCKLSIAKPSPFATVQAALLDGLSTIGI